jgi:hypothetical protein
MPSTGIGAGILASVLLALLTSSVFYVLQDYGPESAIRKYNEAVRNDDILALRQATTQLDHAKAPAATAAEPDLTTYSRSVAQFVRDRLAANGRLRLDGMDRQPDQARATAGVEYVMPTGAPIQFLFVVVKEDHIWKVCPQLTVAALNSPGWRLG